MDDGSKQEAQDTVCIAIKKKKKHGLVTKACAVNRQTI